MAKTVYDTETIELQDGREVTLAPLPIGLLRKFMKAWKNFNDVKDEDDAFNVYIDCCGVALSRHFSSDFETTLTKEGLPEEEYKNYLEDVLDVDTIFKIMEICGGLKLNDPKLMEEAERLAAESLGKN